MDRGNAIDQPRRWDFWDELEGGPHDQCLEMTRYEIEIPIFTSVSWAWLFTTTIECDYHAVVNLFCNSV